VSESKLSKNVETTETDRLAGFVSVPLLVGVKVTVPVAVGVIVKVCGAELLLHVKTMGVDRPPPAGVIVIVPVYGPFGWTVNRLDALFTFPDDGPENVYVVADGINTTPTPPPPSPPVEGKPVLSRLR
jgi:hypothetical protein